MAVINAPVTNHSGGLIGRSLAARVDFQTYPHCAAEFLNAWPMAQGPWTRRPPLKFIDTFVDSSELGYQIPFVSDDQAYNILATESGFEFFTDDGKVGNTNVSTAIAEGTFATSHADLADAATKTTSTLASGTVADLVDESTATAVVWDASATGTLTFDLGSSLTLYDIWLTADSTPTRAPNAFTVKGSATGLWAGEEVTILTVSGAANWTSLEKRKYRITTPGSYRYYRLSMTNSQAGAASYRLSEVSIFDSPWLDNSVGVASVTITGGRLWLDSDGAANSVAEQRITIVTTNTLHILKFDVHHGPVNLRLGTTSGDNDLLDEINLDRGTHYLEFTPTTGFMYLQFYHNDNAGRAVDNVSFLTGTRFIVEHPYLEADLPAVQWQQIGDVLYLTHRSYWTRRLERKGHRSWSVTRLLPDDGPFNTVNTTNITLAGNDTSGEITLTASEDLFTSADEGVLYKLTGAGQTRTETATAEDTYTDGIKVTGVGSAARTFRYDITGVFTATVTLQRSSGNENDYTDFQTFTSPTSATFYDALDNQTWYYRLAVKPGDFTSGSVGMELSYAGGSSEGVVRVISITNGTTATAEVLETLASTDAVRTWKRGAWNGDDLYPTAVAHCYGRLWFGRGIKIWSSQSDDFSSFLEGTNADNAISVTLGSASSIRWMAALGHLIIGTKTRELIGVPNTASQPVSPSNFQTLPGSNRGGMLRMPASADGSILFMLRSANKLMQFTQNPKALSETSYVAVDLNELSPDLLKAGVVKIAMQRTPEPRVYVVLNSGECRVLLFRRDVGDLGIAAWSTIKSKGGIIEDVNVIADDARDSVYMVVKRTVDGATQRSVQLLGPESGMCDEDDYYLDAALSYDLERPAANATPSANTGTITIATDADAFVVGDVNSKIWINGGRATITGYTNARLVTCSVIFDLTEVDEWDEPVTAISGTWGFNPNVSTVSGLDHLEGETVDIYADRSHVGTAVVASGAITLPDSASVVHVGIDTRARWKSMKLAYGAQKGTALAQIKAIKDLRLILDRTGPGLYRGYSFSSDHMIPLTLPPATQDGAPVPLFTGEPDVSGFAMKQGTDSNTDPRVCLEIRGPAPATVLAYVPQVDERDR